MVKATVNLNYLHAHDYAQGCLAENQKQVELRNKQSKTQLSKFFCVYFLP